MYLQLFLNSHAPDYIKNNMYRSRLAVLKVQEMSLNAAQCLCLYSRFAGRRQGGKMYISKNPAHCCMAFRSTDVHKLKFVSLI